MIVYMVSVDLSGLLWLWVGYLISVFDHVLLKSTLVIRPLAQLHQYVKVTVFLRQRRNPLMLTQLHCHNHRQHNYIKHIVCYDLQLIWPHGQTIWLTHKSDQLQNAHREVRAAPSVSACTRSPAWRSAPVVWSGGETSAEPRNRSTESPAASPAARSARRAAPRLREDTPRAGLARAAAWWWSELHPLLLRLRGRNHDA